MFKPHVTVACVVQAEDTFLLVEEMIHGKMLWNQPAGHLEHNETLLEAAQRELWEETGIHASPQSLLKLFQWTAPDGSHFLRFTFAIDFIKICPTYPQDLAINRCLWLPAKQIIQATNLRSPLVRESVLCYLQPQRYPLGILSTFA